MFVDSQVFFSASTQSTHGVCPGFNLCRYSYWWCPKSNMEVVISIFSAMNLLKILNNAIIHIKCFMDLCTPRRWLHVKTIGLLTNLVRAHISVIHDWSGKNSRAQVIYSQIFTRKEEERRNGPTHVRSTPIPDTPHTYTWDKRSLRLPWLSRHDTPL